MYKLEIDNKKVRENSMLRFVSGFVHNDKCRFIESSDVCILLMSFVCNHPTHCTEHNAWGRLGKLTGSRTKSCFPSLKTIV